MRGSARERKPGVWELRVELGRDAITGRRRQLSRTFRGGKRDAETALNQLLADAGKGAFSGTDARVSDLLERWLDLSEADLSPTTLRRYRGLIDVHIAGALGDRPLHKIRTSDLDAFYLALVRQVGLAPATVRQVHAILRRALGQAVRWGWIVSNPAVNTSPPRVRRPDIKPPTPVEVLRLIQTADEADPEFSCFLRLAAATGARRGELCALRWSSFDPFGHTVLIKRAVIEVPGGLLEKDTKTHSARRIALDPDSLVLVDAHQARMTERARIAGVELATDPYLFSLDPDCGRPWSPDRVTKRFVSLRHRLGMESVRLHDLRHFAATRLLAAGVPVRTVSGRLGHANASTTLGVYAHFLEESDQQAADVMGNLLEARPPAASA